MMNKPLPVPEPASSSRSNINEAGASQTALLCSRNQSRSSESQRLQSAEYFNAASVWGEKPYQLCLSRRPSPGRPIGGLLLTRAKATAASDWLVLEGGGTSGPGCCCCRCGCLSRTCVRWAPEASWSYSLCTLLQGHRTDGVFTGRFYGLSQSVAVSTC